MSQVGSPDFLGTPYGLGGNIISEFGTQNGGVARTLPLVYVGRAESIMLYFVAHPGTTKYVVTWEFYGYDQTRGLATGFMYCWANGSMSVAIPVVGPFLLLEIQPMGGVATDTYDLTVVPTFTKFDRPRAPVNGAILSSLIPTNFAVGEVKQIPVQKMAWGLAYLQYGLNGGAWNIQAQCQDASGNTVGYAFSFIIPTNPATNVVPVMIPPYCLNVIVSNNTGAINTGYYTLTMAP